VVRLFSDSATLDSALRAGTVDFEATTDFDSARALAGSNVKVQSVPTPDFYYIAMNALTPAQHEFTDVRVRQAVNLAINRPEIAQVALAGQARVTGMPPSAFRDGCTAANMPGAKPDVAKAKSLMAAAGVKSIDTTLYIAPNTGAFAAPQIAQVVKENLAAIGIDANIQTVDTPTWVDIAFTKSTFSMTVNWWTGFGDPTLRPSSWNPNVAGYVKGFMKDDPTLDSLITRSSAMPRGAARTALFQQMCQRIANNANVVPLVSKDLPVVYRSDRIVPVLPNFEPNGFPWRYIWKYTLVGKR
jgi:peptide/nickel transport system substrate-binding protein